jgi:lipid II:glycine glycyltransferase (peptidoglycan interpeptide bridge formation enzyme)
MLIKEIKNKNVWEDFLLGREEKTFLQSWNWGEFQKMMVSASVGKIWRLGIYDNSKLVSVALIVKTKAKRGTFLLVPHAPSVAKEDGPKVKYEALKTLLEELKKIAKKENCSFIRVSPIWERNEENSQIFKKLGFRKAPIHTHPEATWKLDISPSEEELLSQMRKTTRYLIRQAQKNDDIEISQSSKIEDIKIFNKLYQEVVKTQHFIPFSLDYLKNEFSAFKSDEQISLFFGRYQGEIIASAFVLFWSKIGFYHHAALSSKERKIPIAYLLQWEAIKEAKRRGCKLYDFWGYVNPKKYPKHPWAGPTLFKMGFGGSPHFYVKTRDLPLSLKYWPTYLFEKIRKIKRGL